MDLSQALRQAEAEEDVVRRRVEALRRAAHLLRVADEPKLALRLEVERETRAAEIDLARESRDALLEAVRADLRRQAAELVAQYAGGGR